VTFFGSFTGFERALTLAGVAPLALMGCGVHERSAIPIIAALPVPSYQVLMPVPPAAPRPAPPAALARAVETLRNQFDGLAGIAVHSVDDGWAIDSVDADRPMPQQSVSKLWVAMTLLDAVDTGRVSLADRVTITRNDLTLFHQPIAALVKDGGYTTTVSDLYRRAMTMSDNTANDRVLAHVGGPAAVRDFFRRKGITGVKFGPGERLLQSRTAGLTWKQDMAMGRAFEAARARLPASVRQSAYQSYVADPIDGATPAGIADALVRLKRGELLSPQSTAFLLSTMESSRTGHARLRAAVPSDWRVAHKTGTGQDLLGRTAGFNDVGILTAPDGKSYAIAVMIGDTRRPVRERQLLMQAAVAAVVSNYRTAGFADR
jgi:beta-lactamase class A